MKPYIYPGVGTFIARAIAANGKPHARDRIDANRALRDCSDQAGYATARATILGGVDDAVREMIRTAEARRNDLQIALDAADLILAEVQEALGLVAAPTPAPVPQPLAARPTPQPTPAQGSVDRRPR